MKIKESEAWAIVNEIRKIVKKHGLWVSVSTEERPDLKMIRVNEISIKVEGE